MITATEGKCFLGKTLIINDGSSEMEVTLDVGPRIISFKKTGGENIMFNDTEENITKDVSAIYGEGKAWKIFGGHRVWLSPEGEETYYPDSEGVSWEREGDSFTFAPPLWEKAMVLPTLKIVCFGSGKFKIIMEIKNCSGKSQKFSVWGLTVLKSGGELIVPLSQKDTGYLANRNLVLWHYTDIKDSRLTLSNNEIVVKSNNKDTFPLKIGTYLKEIRAEYRLGDTVFIKEAEGTGGEYPDYHCNFETYTNNFIHEVETLSELKEVKSGESHFLEENWSIK